MAEKQPDAPQIPDIDQFLGTTKGVRPVIKATDNLASDAGHIYPMGIPMDCQLGGGVYSGKIYEVSGRESHGKSAWALAAAVAYQRYWEERGRKGIVFWIESESVFDKLRAKRFGLDIESVITDEVGLVEDGFESIIQRCRKSIEKKIPLFIVWDTIASTVTRAQMAGNAKEGKIVDIYGGGRQEKPRLIKFYLEAITKLLGEGDITLILVNQVYEGGEGDVTPGGLGIRFHASVRLNLNKVEEIKEILAQGIELTKAIVSNVKTVKNKLVLPGLTLPLVIHGESGIDEIDTLMRYLKIRQLITVGGAGWCKLMWGQKEYNFQTLKKFKEIIENDPSIKTYMEYLAWKSFAEISVLLKVRYFGRLRDYETKLGISPLSTLTDEEIELAKYIYKDIQDLNYKDDGTIERVTSDETVVAEPTPVNPE